MRPRMQIRSLQFAAGHFLTSNIAFPH
jgi:hypothetical protein